MVTYTGVHVFMGKRPQDEALDRLNDLVRQHFDLFAGEAVLGSDPESEWIEVRLSDDEGCPRLGQALSRDLATDAVCMVAEWTVDGLAYWRFSMGEEVRCLIHGMTEEGVWEIVRGRPEAWEERILFRPEELDRILAKLPASQVEEHRRIYQGRILAPGNTLPFVNARSYVPWIGRELGLVVQPKATQTVRRSLLKSLLTRHRGGKKNS